MLLLLYVLLVAQYNEASIIIADPHCSLALNNHYGSASLSYDMMRTHINVSMQFESNKTAYACYLCDAIGIEYCDSSNKSTILLSTELAFNVMTMITTEGGQKRLKRVYDVDNGSFTIDIPVSFSSCDESLMLFIGVFASTQKPDAMIFLTVLREDTGEKVNRIPCNDSDLLFDDIDCSVVGPFNYYVLLETPNCIANRLEETNIIISPSYNNNPSLYWYKESLSQALAPSLLSLEWCGINWLTILRQSDISYRCGRFAYLYVDLDPWYNLAIEYISARLNMVYFDSSIETTILLLADDNLERTCHLRQTAEHMNNTVFASLYRQLLLFNHGDVGVEKKEEWCQEIEGLLNRSDMDEGHVPFYVTLYREWFFPYFSFFILYTTEMKIHVLIALTLLSIVALLFLFFAIVAPIWICCMRCYYMMDIRKRRLSAMEPILYDEL